MRQLVCNRKFRIGKRHRDASIKEREREGGVRGRGRGDASKRVTKLIELE